MTNFKATEDEMFRKQAYYSIHPTLAETGIGIGGFKKPHDTILNVDVGDFAVLDCEGEDDGLIVEIIKYAGEKPWWKGYRYPEGYPSWIVKSLSHPFHETYTNGNQLLLDKMPIQDRMLSRVDKPNTLAKE